MIYYSMYKSPIGDMYIASTDYGICKIAFLKEEVYDFLDSIGSIEKCIESTNRNIAYINQLSKYFSGNLKEFHMGFDIKGTDYQIKVWRELMSIPYGQVRTYGYISKVLGSSPRAVGQANKKNPLPIVIPCHRVVSSNGIGGYGGQKNGDNIDIKKYLLSHENSAYISES